MDYIPLADPRDLGLSDPSSPAWQAAEVAIARASAQMRAAVGHAITTEVLDLVMDPPLGRTLHLPGVHLRDVAVAVGGQTVTDVQVSPRTGVLRRPGGWGSELGSVHVVAVAGLDEVPEDVRAAVVERAQITLLAGRSHGATQIAQGSRSVTLSAAAAGGSTARWVEVVERHRLVTTGGM